MKKYITLFTAFIVLALFASICIRQCQKISMLKSSYNAVNSSMNVYKNKYGQEVAKIKIIETERRKDFLKMESQDSTIKKLQKLVKQKKPETAYIIETVTNLDTITLIDTNGYFEFSDEWIDLIGQATDTLKFHLVVRNEYQITEKKGYAEITNINPYTSTNTLRVYKDIPRKKRFVVGAGFGGMVGYEVITKKPAICVGVNLSLNYKLFEF